MVMNMCEYCDILNKQLVITYHPNSKFSAVIEGLEIKDGGCLVYSSGRGETPEDAVNEYVKGIAGKRVVFGAYTDKRHELDVPKGLTGI